MSDEALRGRIQDPRPHASYARRPSPGLAARIKMLEADAEKRNPQLGRLSPSPSPHRSRSRPRTSSVSASSEVSGISSTINIPTSIPTTNGDVQLKLPKDLPPTPTEEDDPSTNHTHLDTSSIMTTDEPAPPPGDPSPDPPTPQPETEPAPFNPYGYGGLQRRSSVVSLSRISFAAQLSRLTSLSLPLREELSERIRKMPTSAEMCDGLTNAGNQIGRWIDTAKKVLRGLDAEDDVEWAAQGKESLSEVDEAVKKFSALMNVYIELIDEVQQRPDSHDVDSQLLLDIVGAMEDTINGWQDVQKILKGVKDQVETAMEWTELWTTILQDIQAELEACQTLVFEMEERRHRSLKEENAGAVDIDTLETIMEETPGSKYLSSGRTAAEVEDSSLLGLFARMQPLRASLDFLPMRLQSFQMRAEEIFPSACEDLDTRRKTLERKWKKLSADAESLRKELGEDRWITIFRNAGKQANAMMDSIERSMTKLKEAVVVWEESGGRIDKDIYKKMESFEAKRIHYGAAAQRTFSIISKGISERFTVNGEIIRLESAMNSRWQKLSTQMDELDQTLKLLQLDTQALRDSISSLNTLDIGSSLNTPGSSPASSVYSLSTAERKLSPSSAGRRTSNVSSNKPSPSSHIPKRNPFSRLSSSPANSERRSVSPNPGMPRSRATSSTSLASNSSTRMSGTRTASGSSLPARPRWNGSTKTDDGTIGHNFKPLTLTTPSPYRKVTPPTDGTGLSNTRIPIPSPLSQANTPSPTSPRYSFSSAPSSRRSSTAMAHVSPSPGPRLMAPTRPDLRHKMSLSQLSSYQGSSKSYQGTSKIATPKRPSSRLSTGDGADDSPKISVRPASAMASSTMLSPRNRTFLPRPTTPSSKRSSFSGNAKVSEKPRWRP